MMVIIIIVLSIMSIILGYSTYNLMKKQEVAEDVLISYMNYLDNLSRVIEITDKKLKDLDHKESFKSDDEIGFFFDSVKQIQDILNTFKITEMK